MKKTALVTGATGMDGSYLLELLLDKGYKIYGLMRRSSVDTTERIRHLIDNPNLEIITGDITDSCLMYKLVSDIKPDEVYNLAAMSHVGVSFSNPVSTFEIDTLGCLYLLEAIRLYSPNTKIVQASTSELFGSNYDKITFGNEIIKFQNEKTHFEPNSPYAVAKLAAHNLIRVYRDSYKIHANASIAFNHEGSRRTPTFVTRKITRYVAALYNYLNVPNHHHTELQIFKERMEVSTNTFNEVPKLRLGNIYSSRDWSHAKDIVYGQWLMLQQEKPDDFVFASEEAHTVEEFLKKSFKYVGIKDYKKYIEIDENLFRPNEVEYLRGDASKAQKVLGWKPSVSFDDLIEEMIDYDVKSLQTERLNYVQKATLQKIEV